MEQGRHVWSREIDLSFLWRTPRDHPMETLMGLGVFLRVVVYLWGRSYWLDEGTLLGNILGKSVLDFSGYLQGDQLAPFGFLIAERVLVALLGSSEYVTRLIPLACAIGSLWLFRALVVRSLAFPAALVAMALFALSDDLVYYASELKPYSSDVAVSLIVLLAGARMKESPLGPRQALALTPLLIAAPWLSFPSAFVVAGVGLPLLIGRLVKRTWSDVARLTALAAAWLLSFALAYRASHALLNPATTMYVFWDFAFLPFPPRGADDLRRLAGVLLDVFVNPLNLLPWFLPAWCVIFPVALMLIGLASLSRRDRTAMLLLVVPILLAMAAASARRYPFHGRLILGLVPAFFILLAEGADWFRLNLGRRPFLAIALLLLAYPSLSTLYQGQSARSRDFNAHGDLHANRFVE